MSVMRNRPKGARFASFGLGLCIFSLMPNEIGYQDITSLLARQPGVAERWQKRVFYPAATIQLATYSFGRPIGTSTPQTANYRLASLDNQGIDMLQGGGKLFLGSGGRVVGTGHFGLLDLGSGALGKSGYARSPQSLRSGGCRDIAGACALGGS